MLMPIGYKRKLLKEAEVSIKLQGASEKAKGEMREIIVQNLYSVVKYSWKMGMPLRIADLPKINVGHDHPIFKYDQVGAAYEDGTIYVRSANWHNRNILAHELFHHHQHMRGIDSIKHHSDSSFLEGGADLFALAYIARGCQRKNRVASIESSIGTEINFRALKPQFMELGEEQRILFLNSLLGGNRPAKITDEIYKDGAKLASMSYVLNGYGLKKTLKGFLEPRNGLIADLARPKPIIHMAVTDFMSLLRQPNS